MSAAAIVGDPKVDSAYVELMYGAWRVRQKFDRYLPREYGRDLDLILLEFFVEGAHHWFTIPERIRMGRYSARSKAIRIKIPMPKDVSGAVLSTNVGTVNTFLTETFRRVGGLITSSRSLSGLDFDVQKFNRDYQVFMQHLLDDAP